MKQDALINLNSWYTQARVNIINNFIGGHGVSDETERDSQLHTLFLEYLKNKEILEKE